VSNDIPNIGRYPAFVLYPDGMTKTVQPEDGVSFTLDETYTHTECRMVEVVHLPGGKWILIADEEGLLKEAPLNVIASLLNGMQYHGQPIVGTVLVCPSEMFK